MSASSTAAGSVILVSDANPIGSPTASTSTTSRTEVGRAPIRDSINSAKPGGTTGSPSHRQTPCCRTSRTPEPQRAIADRQHRSAHPAAATVAQQIRPGLGGLPVAVGQRDEFLAAVAAYSDHHQQAQLGLLQAHVDM